jgi:hypothetical protein
VCRRPGEDPGRLCARPVTRLLRVIVCGLFGTHAPARCSRLGTGTMATAQRWQARDGRGCSVRDS